MTLDPPDSVYTCECCGGNFKRNDNRTNEDTLREAADNGFEGMELAFVCDMCYGMLMAARRRNHH